MVRFFAPSSSSSGRMPSPAVAGAVILGRSGNSRGVFQHLKLTGRGVGGTRTPPRGPPFKKEGKGVKQAKLCLTTTRGIDMGVVSYLCSPSSLPNPFGLPCSRQPRPDPYQHSLSLRPSRSGHKLIFFCFLFYEKDN